MTGIIQVNDLWVLLPSTVILTAVATCLILRLAIFRPIRNIFFSTRQLEQEIQGRSQELRGSKKKLEEAYSELLQLFNAAGGGMRLLDTNFHTLLINNKFEEMTGLEEEKIINSLCYRTFSCGFCHTRKCILRRILKGEDRIEQRVDKMRVDGKKVPCILTATAYRSPTGKLLGVIEDFKDISAIEQLLDKQQINIGLAQRILSLVNSGLPRYIELNGDSLLFSSALFSLCHVAGGDHFFVRQLEPCHCHPRGRTVLSLKDQSGHEVDCLLKSIATDFMHNVILHSQICTSLNDEVNLLNRELCTSTLFREDDFVTAVLVEIDHATLDLHYISCGHPPFLLIRDGQVMSFPAPDGIRQCPLGVSSTICYVSEQIHLQVGDKLLFYTDGLTDMSVQNTGKVLSLEELKNMTLSLLDTYGSMHISEIMDNLFGKVIRRSGENVVPFQKNSSRDDVTLLGIEIEDQSADGIEEIYIKDTRELCDRVEELQNELLARAKENDFDLDPYQLRIVLDESLSNAWNHGHRCDPEKPIEIRWRFRNDLCLSIIDQGAGFDYTKIADPRIKSNLLEESGRGLFLIRLFASHVYWKDRGRQIHIAIKRPVPTDRRTALRVSKTSPLDIWKLNRM